MKQNFKKLAKTGRHVFHSGGKRFSLVPGGEVYCDPKDMGSFIDQYKLIGGGLSITEEDEKPGKSLIIVAKGRGYFDIINVDNPDKPLNDKGLREGQAKKVLGQMIIDLQKAEEVDEDAPEDSDVAALNDLSWDDLVAVMKKEEIPMEDEYETEEDLVLAIVESRGE